MNYEEIREAFLKIIGTKKCTLTEISRKLFWIQDDDGEVQVKFDTARKSLRIEKNKRLNIIGFIPMDGKSGVFTKGNPPVKDENRFKYRWFNNNKYEEKTAGSCDCLLIDHKWRFFELKTEAFSKNEEQANQEHEKASLQLHGQLPFLENRQ